MNKVDSWLFLRKKKIDAREEINDFWMFMPFFKQNRLDLIFVMACFYDHVFVYLCR